MSVNRTGIVSNPNGRSSGSLPLRREGGLEYSNE